MQPDGKIVAGGFFNALGGQTRSAIGRLNADGTLDAAFNAALVNDLNPADRRVNALALQPDGKILVGGIFTTLNGQSRNYIGRLNADGTLDASFINPDAGDEVYALALQPDGKILVGGLFTTIAGQTRNHIARLNADGSLDAAFNPGASGSVLTIVLQADGKILVGGGFQTLGGSSHLGLGRLNPDGSLDATFILEVSHTGGAAEVSSLEVSANGLIFLGGNFDTVSDGGGANSIDNLAAVWPSDGDFAGGTADANDPVAGLALQADGKLLAGGYFNLLGGHERPYLGRLNNTDAAAQTLSISGGGSGLTWARSGSAPEVAYVTFEWTADGVNYTLLGAGNRVSGGWNWIGALPPSACIYRARGVYSSGQFNGSVSITESKLKLCSDAVTVSNVNDSGAGSLRQALADVCPLGVVTFGGDYTIRLASSLSPAWGVTIDGAGHNVTISGDTNGDGSGDVRVFNVSAGITLNLNHVTVTKGYTGNTGDNGGGLYNAGAVNITDSLFSNNQARLVGGAIYTQEGAALTVANSTFSGNTSGDIGGALLNEVNTQVSITGSVFADNRSTNGNGGAIYSSGTLTVTDSTFSGNTARYAVGGILNYYGTLTINNSTFYNNSGDTDGGVIHSEGGATTLSNTIVANSAPGAGCSAGGGGTLTDGGGNLAWNSSGCPGIGANPRLAAFGNYGGSTQTFALLPGSAAIDAGNDAACAATDQRGVARPQGAHCDIGAFESRGFVLGSPTGNLQSADVNTAFATPLGLTVTANDASEPVDEGVVAFSAPSSGASTTFAPSALAAISAGAVSLPATANGTAGGPYLVTASAAGAAPSLTYTLVNNSTTVPVTAIYVDDDYNASTPGWNVDHFASMQGGIDAVSRGGTVTVYAGTYTENVTLNNHAELSLAGDITLNGSLTLATGSFHAASYTLSLSGDFANVAVFDPGAGAVIFNGSGLQTIGGSGVTTFNNLTINNTSGLSPAVKLKTDATVNGTLTLQAGVLGVYAENFILNGPVINGGGSMAGLLPTTTYAMASPGQDVAAGQYGNLAFNNQPKTLPNGAVNILGNFDPGTAGGHTVTGSMVAFVGSGVQTIAHDTNLNNLIVGDGVTLMTSSDVTVSGVLTNNG